MSLLHTLLLMAHEFLTISTDGIFLSSLRYIEKCLTASIKNGEVITKIENCDGRNKLIIVSCGSRAGQASCDGVKQSEVEHKITSILTDAIADIVVTDFKYYFIKTNLRLPIDDDINRHAFIRALSNFDRTKDLAIAKLLIKLTPNFLLDSFYTFSLDTLKIRWQEVCSLANDNACFLVCDGTFRELLRFLIHNLETREAEVHLFERDGKVEVLSNRLKPINIYVNDELSEDAQVISILISVAPKRIILHQNINANPIIDFVQSLFGNCVQIVQN